MGTKSTRMVSPPGVTRSRHGASRGSVVVRHDAHGVSRFGREDRSVLLMIT
jgi:hypothetical protein